MIGIRADANEIVATGHIMRCMTIAKQIQKLGEDVLFFLADDYGTAMLEEKHLPYVVLGTDWENPMEEIPVLVQKLAEKKIQTVLFDSYRMTKDYFGKLNQALGDTVRFAYIDDLFEDVYPVDILINYNAYHTQFPYEKVYDEKTQLCLGPPYVPLREEFGKADLEEGYDNSVLLSCGGGDIWQALHGIMEQAVLDTQLQKVMFHIVLGRFHQKKELLEQLAAEHQNIVLHYNVSNMAQLMEECRIAVSAAGTMLYELCAMERPTVFFITADNQRYDSDFFDREKRMVFAGDIRSDREGCIRHILQGIKELLQDPSERRKMKEKLRQITDGKGAERIAEALVK